MLKFTFLIILITVNSYSATFDILQITTQPAFNYFASLEIWLFIISAPALLLISLIKYARRAL